MSEGLLGSGVEDWTLIDHPKEERYTVDIRFEDLSLQLKSGSRKMVFLSFITVTHNTCGRTLLARCCKESRAS